MAGIRQDLSARGAANEIAVASAAVCDIGAPGSDRIVVTGSIAITSLGSSPHRRIRLRWADGAAVSHDPPSITLLGAADLAAAAGDIWHLESDASGTWRMIGCELASLAPGSADGGTF
jgi:hypothetical protein